MSTACAVPGCDAPSYCRSVCTKHYGRLRAHGSPSAVVQPKRANGGGHVDRLGYISHSVGGRNGRKVFAHIAVAESALGKRLPPGAIVHHVNEIPGDNRPENLVICPGTGYHKLIHMRMRALVACGNANYRKCMVCGIYDDPLAMGKTEGSFRHKRCHAERQKERYRAARANGLTNRSKEQ